MDELPMPEVNPDVDEHGDLINDAWKTTIFSGQNVYHETLKISGVSCFFLLVVIGLT